MVGRIGKSIYFREHVDLEMLITVVGADAIAKFYSGMEGGESSYYAEKMCPKMMIHAGKTCDIEEFLKLFQSAEREYFSAMPDSVRITTEMFFPFSMRFMKTVTGLTE